MELITWNEKYSVGNVKIDTQHKKLVSLINELHQAMKEGKGKEIVGKTLQSLISYTTEHFSSEEKMMLDAKFPSLTAHVIEHKELVKQVNEFHESFKNGSVIVSMELIQFLKNWLLNHISGTDMKYKGYLK